MSRSICYKNQNQENLIKTYRFANLAWMIAMIATLGSIFFGEIMKLPPCTLCWYQRICLFPLTILLAVGIVRKDNTFYYYALPLVIAGLGIAIYHNLIYYDLIPESLSPCTLGVSCSSRQIEWFGFITIPLMAFGAFLSIFVCLLAHQKQHRRFST